jgi:ATP-dependent DNA helicase DinG
VGEARELRLPSPFDAGRRMRLYVPPSGTLRGPPGAAAPVDVAAEIARLLEASDGRALLLFASHRQLRAVHAVLAPRLPYRVLLQGEAPRDRLLAAFRADVSSVLFATASFWQGVDVPGEALTLVVIDKLPFRAARRPVALRPERAGRARRRVRGSRPSSCPGP